MPDKYAQRLNETLGQCRNRILPVDTLTVCPIASQLASSQTTMHFQ
jgi:hypothetical protein